MAEDGRERLLLSSFVLNDSGSSALRRHGAEDVGRYQPWTPSSRALRPGAAMVFISVWPVLRSLPPGDLVPRADERRCPRSNLARRSRGNPRESRHTRRLCSRMLGSPLQRPLERFHRLRASIPWRRSRCCRTITRRSRLLFCLNRRMPPSPARRIALVLALDVRPCGASRSADRHRRATGGSPSSAAPGREATAR